MRFLRVSAYTHSGQKWIRRQYQIVNVLVLFVAMATFQGIHADESMQNRRSSGVDISTVDKINNDIQKKLVFYNESFPNIQFVHLKNGEWEKSLQALELFIGYQATNLDYEHPKDLREDLLFVTVAKIQMMLINKVASSYLFKVGELPLASKEYACVITLDPEAMVLNNRVATEYFIDLPQDVLSALSPSAYLDKEQHLDFILDHEVFHCLDTYDYGGIPMSKKEFSSRYECFKRENRADMFAIAMHISRHKALTPYVHNIVALRGMTLINGEMQHDSAKAMQLIMSSDRKIIVDSGPGDLVKHVEQLYKTIAPDYDEYLNYRVSAVEAIGKLGKEVNEWEEPYAPADRKPDQKIVNDLIEQTRNYYQQYTGVEYPSSAH